MKDLKEIKKLLVVVDMVNGFVKEGILHDEGISRIIPNIESLINRDDIDDVVFFRDAHTKDSVEFKYFPTHCLEDEHESEIVDELIPYTTDRRVYLKNSTSGIFVPDYIDDINGMKNLTEVIITGCCTDICVMNLAIPQRNYFNHHNKEVDVIVPIDAVATYDIEGVHNAKEYSEMAFKLMKLNGVKVLERGEY